MTKVLFLGKKIKIILLQTPFIYTMQELPVHLVVFTLKAIHFLFKKYPVWILLQLKTVQFSDEN